MRHRPRHALSLTLTIGSICTRFDISPFEGTSHAVAEFLESHLRGDLGGVQLLVEVKDVFMPTRRRLILTAHHLTYHRMCFLLFTARPTSVLLINYCKFLGCAHKGTVRCRFNLFVVTGVSAFLGARVGFKQEHGLSL